MVVSVPREYTNSRFLELLAGERAEAEAEARGRAPFLVCTAAGVEACRPAGGAARVRFSLVRGDGDGKL
jgi:hypothetical protein